MSKLGVKVLIYQDTDILAKLKEVKEYGFECCQMDIWDTALYTDEKAKEINDAVAETGVEISSLWAGWSGPGEWNVHAGPMTLGLVPPAYRMKRAEELLMAGEFAVKINVPRVATHVGFLPENMNDPEYLGVVAIIRHIVARYKKLGINFLFETGQETPITLLRVIEDVSMDGKYDNIGINMDTANLIMYGKANSADAILIFGKYVMDTHIKDGFYPTDGMRLGREVAVGSGLADIPEVIKRLQAVNYTGNYIIEREISGEQQTKDIIDTLAFLKSILRQER